MKKKMSWWIKKRQNPQFDKPYYVACGQLGKRAAQKKEKSLYGFNVMIEYPTEEEYNEAIKNLRSHGFSVQ